MTRAVVYAPWQAYERKFLAAAAAADMGLYASPSMQDFGSQLFRDPDAVGIMWAMGMTSAGMTMRQYRLADVGNRIVVLLHERQTSCEALERAHVLSAGADDVQFTNIDPRELSARLKALAMRGAYFDHLSITMADCTFVHGRQTIEGPRGDVKLTGKESAILLSIARSSGAITKTGIMDAVYGDADEPPCDKIIDVLICKLRKKIERATAGRDVIQTVHGQGYRFEAEGFSPHMIPARAVRMVAR